MSYVLVWLFALILTLPLGLAGGGSAAAQGQSGHIERIANKRLSGTAYAKLPGLSYEECEARCLADAKCVALEHFRGGRIVNRGTQCRLFSAAGEERASTYSDIGYRRAGAGPARTAKKAAKPEAAPAEKSTATRNGGTPAAGDTRTRAPGTPPAISERERAPAAGAPGGEPRRQALEAKRTDDDLAARQRALEQLEQLRRQQQPQYQAARPPAGSGPPSVSPGLPPPAANFAPPPPPPAPPRAANGTPPPAAKVAPPPPPPRAANGTSPTASRSPGPASTTTEAPAPPRSRSISRSSPPPTSPPPAGAEPALTGSPGPVPRAPESSAASSGREVTRANDAAPFPTTPSASPSEWDVVPVFYGTDRKRRDSAKRIAYGSDRARRLEVGRALVTVPKSHQVPNVERPWAIKIPYLDITLYQEAEDPRRHFTIQEIAALSPEAMLQLVRARLAASNTFKDQALIVVHGYNNGFDDALYRTAQISYDLKYDGAAFLYSWPSGAGITSYTYDRESAQQAEQYLNQFLLMVMNESGAKGVSIIAHSMGNQPLLQVLRDLKRTSPNLPRINQIILAAPDVDRDAFEYIASQIRDVGQGITMYVSSNDVALGVSRRFAGGIPRAGDVPVDLGPAVVQGVDTIDISDLSTDYLALNHSTYAEKTALLQDIETLLRTGTRPPERRLSALQRVRSAQGDYWRYVVGR